MLCLVSDLCTNIDGSHNKILHKYFFQDVQSIIIKSERIETDLWKEKYNDAIVKCAYGEAIKKMLNHDIITYVAGHRNKKLFDKVTIKCHACANKLSYGHGRTINLLVKSRISYNMSCICMRDEGGLRWLSRIVIFPYGVIIHFFEEILKSDGLMKDYCASCSSSRVALLAIKEMVH